MKSVPSWIWYSILRVLAFAVPLALLLLVGTERPIAVIVAALLGLGISLVFLRKQRGHVSEAIYRARHGQPTFDGSGSIAEDAALEDAAADPKHQ